MNEQLEFLKCCQDPSYFLEKYVQFSNLTEDFTLRQYQKDLMNCYKDNKKVIVKAPRQSTKTTTTAAYLLWYCLFRDQASIHIICEKGQSSRNILSIVKEMYDGIPQYLKPDNAKCVFNRSSITLNDGLTRITTGTDIVSGSAANLFYLDEFAYYKTYNDDLQQKLINEIEWIYPNAKILMTSTPNTNKDYFCKLWYERTDFAKFEITNDMIPGRDSNWKKKAIEYIGEEQFKKEYNNQFMMV